MKWLTVVAGFVLPFIGGVVGSALAGHTLWGLAAAVGIGVGFITLFYARREAHHGAD